MEITEYIKKGDSSRVALFSFFENQVVAIVHVALMIHAVLRQESFAIIRGTGLWQVGRVQVLKASIRY